MTSHHDMIRSMIAEAKAYYQKHYCPKKRNSKVILKQLQIKFKRTRRTIERWIR